MILSEQFYTVRTNSLNCRLDSPKIYFKEYSLCWERSTEKPGVTLWKFSLYEFYLKNGMIKSLVDTETAILVTGTKQQSTQYCTS